MKDFLKVKDWYSFVGILIAIENLKRFALLFTLLHSLPAPNDRLSIMTFRSSILALFLRSPGGLRFLWSKTLIKDFAID